MRRNLRIVLSKLKAHGIRVRREKYEFTRDSVESWDFEYLVKVWHQYRRRLRLLWRPQLPVAVRSLEC